MLRRCLLSAIIIKVPLFHIRSNELLLSSDLIKYHVHYIISITVGLFLLLHFVLFVFMLKNYYYVPKSSDITARGTHYTT